MKITRDLKLSRDLMDRFHKVLQDRDKDRQGIHLSDLLYPKQAYWKKVKPQPLTDTEVMYFLSGIASEDALLEYVDYEHGKEDEWMGIHFTPDFFTIGDVPNELKTRRGFKPNDDRIVEIYDGYIKQLKGYCAILGKEVGIIHAWILAERQEDGSTKPELDSMYVEFTVDELEEERNYLLQTRDSLLLALKLGDCSMLSNCPGWLCGKEVKTMVKNPYCNTCKKEFSSQGFIERHRDSKSGAGHDTVDAQFEGGYIKRCKWFDDCRPYDNI